LPRGRLRRRSGRLGVGRGRAGRGGRRRGGRRRGRRIGREELRGRDDLPILHWGLPSEDGCSIVLVVLIGHNNGVLHTCRQGDVPAYLPWFPITTGGDDLAVDRYAFIVVIGVFQARRSYIGRMDKAVAPELDRAIHLLVGKPRTA
jgi:hypothetical protein